jgi:uncharacterized protein YbjT (DUF2867 family)
MKKILVAGSTGYLGSHIVKELLHRGMSFKAIARNSVKLEALGCTPRQIIHTQVTDRNALEGCCKNIDVVISSLGITRQKDGLTYMQVDYQANKNLLDEAIKSGVKKFIYVSVLRGESLRHLKICEAKERFVEALKNSGLDYTIIRPSGFFSDMSEFHQMAKNGRIYLLGDGNISVNPIHGADLAKVCIDSIFVSKKEIPVGGPEILSHRQIAEAAFNALNHPIKITFIPDWIRRAILRIGPLFMDQKKFGPIEFFLNVMAMDMATDIYGVHTLSDYFKELNTSAKLSSHEPTKA